MGPFALLARFASRDKSPRLDAAPLAPRRLERRRVLDASAAGLLLEALGDPGEFVQVGENLDPPATGQNELNAGLVATNTPPFNLRVVVNPGEISENDSILLIISFDDPDARDRQNVTITWGDDSAPQVFNLGASQGLLLATHQYLDDNPTATPADVYEIEVVVTDAAGATATATKTVLVNNVAPELFVSDDLVVDEGALLDLSLGGLGVFTDVGRFDTQVATISWGDGTATENATVDQLNGSGTLGASHVYADNGIYTATVTLADDDGGVDVETFQVEVRNVAPTLTVVGDQSVNEGALLLLTDLGTFGDPGFDNPLNTFDPGNGGQVEERFFSKIDWGDGTLTNVVPATIDQSGSAGVLTSGSLDGAHVYADNGIYTVTITLTDDDGGVDAKTFRVFVFNVAPTLTLTDRPLAINEGETLNLPDLAIFADPGFDNPFNTAGLSNGGETAETFTYTIDWDDGTVETGQLPASVTSGSPGVATIGTLAASHFYADNDGDNLYTITVTLADDDGGTTTKTILATVLNVNPALQPITATDVNTRGETELTIEFDDPGAEVLTVWVDWGDRLALPPAQRFVAETFVLGPGTTNLTLSHTYSGPPDPVHPTADIVISTFVRDDDFNLVMPVVEIGESETRVVAISNPGIGTPPVAIDTTPQVPRLVFPSRAKSQVVFEETNPGESTRPAVGLRAATGDVNVATERFLELRVIDSLGDQSEGFRLKAEVLADLPGLFRTLPDNHYAIYVVHLETNTRRLVVEVYVRNGKLIDPGDDSEGTRDRPPTDETSGDSDQPLHPAETAPSKSSPTGGPQAEIPQAEISPSGEPQGQSLALAAAIGLAASPSYKSWAQQVDRAVASAGARQWQQLRSRNRYKRKDP